MFIVFIQWLKSREVQEIFIGRSIKNSQLFPTYFLFVFYISYLFFVFSSVLAVLFLSLKFCMQQTRLLQWQWWEFHRSHASEFVENNLWSRSWHDWKLSETIHELHRCLLLNQSSLSLELFDLTVVCKLTNRHWFPFYSLVSILKGQQLGYLFLAQ